MLNFTWCSGCLPLLKTTQAVRRPKRTLRNHSIISVSLSFQNVHYSKNLREHIHCEKLLLKRTFLVLTLRHKRVKINEWEAILWHKSYQKCVEHLFEAIWRLFSIKKYPATEGDPWSMAWCTTGHGLSNHSKLCLKFAKTSYSQEQSSTLLK